MIYIDYNDNERNIHLKIKLPETMAGEKVAQEAIFNICRYFGTTAPGRKDSKLKLSDSLNREEGWIEGWNKAHDHRAGLHLLPHQRGDDSA